MVTVVPEIEGRSSLVLDGDLPKSDWFGEGRSSRLSALDREPHTVIPGRPIGLTPELVQEMAQLKMHLHFYGDFTHGQWKQWITRTSSLAGDYLHLHPQVDQRRWVHEFSRYDAGWLHFFRSANGGEIRRANWDDLNYPARLATYAAAGVPMLQARNDGHIVATQTLVRDLDLGLFVDDMEDLARQFHDRTELTRIRKNVWQKRSSFTFDAQADRLIHFFREVIASRRGDRI